MRKHLVLALLLPALATSALAAGARFTTAAQPAIGLSEPARGTVLRGGSFANVSWTALRTFDAEEWEAFLSVDGGRYYSVRLTPHLDIAVRTFAFLVPNVDSDDVRILIRTGDERDETIVDFPQRFSIRASRAIETPVRSLSGGPEAARPGDDPVVQWSGESGRTQRSTQPQGTIASASFGSAQEIDGALSTQAATAVPNVSDPGSRSVRQRAARPSRSPVARNVLRLTHRLNV